MERSVGREEMLRLLWPLVVGAPLAASTCVRNVRGGMLAVSVADRTWQKSLEPMAPMIVEAANRICGINLSGVQFVPDAQLEQQLHSRARVQEVRNGLKPVSGSPQAAPLDIDRDDWRQVFARSEEKYFAKPRGGVK